MKDKGTSNFSFVLAIIILLMDVIALVAKLEINRATLIMSIVLGLLLFINGMLYRKKGINKNGDSF
ncbi:hypothetical protein [Niallia taxi]|uniref:hypothetical protein n=1 Tax=Niallia taxi TaxID=2499688 RepID=UPI00203CC1D0|nr:hypothetical protein [Niallia taxi]MCM3216450.1 hypothetical protein [Niallia taxi]MED4039069.1 hypothetical protein [Niallia taxi]